MNEQRKRAYVLVVLPIFLRVGNVVGFVPPKGDTIDGERVKYSQVDLMSRIKQQRIWPNWRGM